MSLSALDRRAAITFGRLAARRGLPVTACPYDPGRDDRNRALALLWVRSWRRHRTP
ncbi:hypothetical protein GCM10010466_39960 [Planomonospora alba]|uniref:Uncharacterized protein n=1 Tax=Planomonospora alba TaxID=161354 RepID=A0ABP6NDS8_9ACTN